ncbi:MAG TPA: hypothetical protein VFJ24_07545 [Gaiellales bacterium]|nr:hypothetical protein [Gaiellales bacterium]
MRHYCKVTAEGVAHLFVSIDYGAVCACGRKAYAFALDTEQPTLSDVAQEPAPPWEIAAVPEKVGNARFLL